MNYHWDPEIYQHNSEFQWTHALEALSVYHFNGREQVLDVGCGDGKISYFIAKQLANGHVTGIDSSPSMIGFASTKYNSMPNLTFQLSAAESIGYTARFDLIVSFACLHWVKEQLIFLKTAARALKQDGLMIVNLYPKHPRLWQAIEGVAHSERWASYFTHYEDPHIHYELDEYKHLAKSAGLSVLSAKECESAAVFDTELNAQAFLASWLPHVEEVKPQYRTQFVEDIIQRLNTHSKRIVIPFKRLDFILKK